MVHSIRGGGKGGNMAIEIKVHKTEDGHFYCINDPEHIILHEHGEDIKWTSEEKVGEFQIEFKTESPFKTGLKKLKSKDREIEEKVKPHDGRTDYAYYVEPQNDTGKQPKDDPGLIVEP